MKHWITIILALITLCSFGQTKKDYDKIVDSFSHAGQSDKLIPYFKQELKTRPRNEDILRWLGYLHIEDNQLDLGEKYYNEALTVNPKCARCYMHIGRVYSLKKDNKKALTFFDKSILIDPADASFYAKRAQLKETTGDKPGTLSDLNKSIELDPKNADYYIQRGMYHSNQNNFTLAITDLNKAVELAPNHYYPYLQRSSIYYEKQMMKEALEDVNTGIRLDSTQVALYNGRGAIYTVLKEHEKAIADYTKGIQLNPGNYYAYYYRSHLKYQLEDMGGSCSDIHDCYAILVKQDPDNSLKPELEYSIGNYCDSTKPSYYYQRGIAFYNLQQFEKAVDIYSRGVKIFPTNAMILSFRGNAFLKLKDYTNALSDYYASIENKNNVMDNIVANQKHTGIPDESLGAAVNEFMASMQFSIAESKFALGQYAEALVEINKGIEMAPSLKEFGKENYLNVRGNIFLAVGKYQEALSDFNKCIQLNPSFAIGYVNRAIAKINLENRFSITSSAISVGITNQTFNPNWTFPLKTGVKKSDADIVSAISDCNKAITIDPNLNFAYYIRGQAKKMLNYSDYCFDLLKAKNLGYDVEPALLKECEK